MSGGGSPEHGTVSKIGTCRRGSSVGRRRRLPLGSAGGCATGKCPTKEPSAPTFASVPRGHRGQALIPPDRPATIVFTSGSTGVPKAVLHTCGNHYYNALGSNTNLPLTVGDRWLLNLPLHHVADIGILFRCLLAGAAVVLPGKQRHARPGMLALEDGRRGAESAASEPIGGAAISRCGISDHGDAETRRAR